MLGMWLVIGAFFLILLAFMVMHPRVNGGLRVEASWIAVGLSPALLWLLTTGRLTEFSGFGLGLKLREVSAKSFSLPLDGSRIEPAPLTIEEKGPVGDISELIRRRVAALTFTLGRRGYYNDQAIRQYLDRLTDYEFFRFVIFTDMSGRFRGLVPAKLLWEQLQGGGLDLVRIIEEGAVDRIDGLVAAAISMTSSKREALKKMEAENLTKLPVVNEASRFIGIVERDKLTSSILLDLVSQL